MSDDWTPTTLSHEIIEKVNKVLGNAGKPYFVLDPPTPINKWTPVPIATGGFSWRLEDSTVTTVAMGFSPGPELEKVRSLLVGESVVVYIGADCQWGQYGLSAFPSLVVVSTADQFDILRIERTTGDNYDIQTGDLITQLLSVDKKHGIDIFAADAGSVEFRFKRIPTGQDEADFRRWLQKFAPDCEIPDTLDAPIKLWWD